MGKIFLCTGKYAEIPYCFENLGVKVYSAEELCYVLRENAFLLDREIVEKRLVRWIDEELKLPQLAATLYPLLSKKASAGEFASAILQYVKFYDAETIKKIEEIFQKGANLNSYEKRKTRVDYMVAGGRYAPALFEYDVLLEELPDEERELTARILHNKGVALCGLFLFEDAAQQFKASYELLPHEETLIEYLAAKRLFMEEGDYVSFAAGIPDYYEETLELEKRVQALSGQWENAEEKQRLDTLASFKKEGDVRKYYEETDKRIEELKNNYRANVSG